MSIYDTERSKIYPHLSFTSPKEPQAHRLKKLTDIEAYLIEEIEARERLAEK